MHDLPEMRNASCEEVQEREIEENSSVLHKKFNCIALFT